MRTWPYYTYLDPMRRDYRGREADNLNAIITLDKADIRACDVMLVHYTKPSVGTAMEIHYAWGLGKPIVVVDVGSGRVALPSPWLIYHATYLTATLEDAFDWIASCSLP